MNATVLQASTILRSTGLFGVLLVAACGSGGVHSGVSRDKQGDALSAEEIGAICRATVSYAQSQIPEGEWACRVQGNVVAALQAGLGSSNDIIRQACQERYDDCKATAEAGAETPEARCAESPASAPTCDATVAEIEDCLTKAVQDADAAIESIPTCSEVTQETGAPPQMDPPPSTACEAVQAKCPEAVGLLLY